MRLLMLAPPGGGKGTQAERLAKRYGIDHIATGDMLRAEVVAGSEIGRQARDYLDRGDLVPDELLIDIVARRIVDAAAANGYVLDGFPRTLHQAEAAYHMVGADDGVAPQAVLHLDVGAEEIRSRLRSRAVSEGRGDDTDGTIEHRLDVFHNQTEPLLEYYRDRGILYTLDGGQEADEVTEEIVGLLDRLGLA